MPACWRSRGALYEAAEVDGATAWQRLVKITLPLLVPTLLLAVIFRLVFAFRLFSEVWLLTKGGPARLTEVLAVYLYQGAFRYGDFGKARRGRLDHGGRRAADRLDLPVADAAPHGAAGLSRRWSARAACPSPCFAPAPTLFVVAWSLLPIAFIVSSSFKRADGHLRLPAAPRCSRRPSSNYADALAALRRLLRHDGQQPDRRDRRHRARRHGELLRRLRLLALFQPPARAAAPST